MSGRQQGPPPDVSEDADSNSRNQGSVPSTPSPPPFPDPDVGVRRDENSISFRHFLQPQSDVVPTRHNTRPHHQRSGNGSSSVDLVDIPMLPDFVQDQLIAEAHAESSQPLLDLAPSPSSPQAAAGASGSSQGQGSRLHHYGGLIPSETLLGAHALSSPSQNHNNHTSSLPDFLSDGPMYCNNNSEDTANTGNTTGQGSRGTETRPDFDSDSTLLNPNERLLRRDLLDRSRRISYLENESSRQEAEINGLLGALADSTNSLRLSNERALSAESEVSRLSAQLTQLQNELSTGRSSSGDGISISRPSHSHLSNGPVSHANHSQAQSSRRVTQIANVTEDLLRQLLDQVSELRAAAALESLPHDNHPQDNGDK